MRASFLIFLLSPPPGGRLEGGLPLVIPDAAGFAGVGITATTAAVADVLCTIEAFHIALADDAVVLQTHHCHCRLNIGFHIGDPLQTSPSKGRLFLRDLFIVILLVFVFSP